MSQPHTHQVYRQTKNGLSMLNEPVPSAVRPHEVLVRIKAVSLNYRDILGLGVPTDVVPCCDMAGEVIQVGEAVTDLKQGDRVTANFDSELLYGPAASFARGLGGPEDGVLQQYRVFPALGLLPIPAHLSFEEGACLLGTHLTAWNALFGGIALTPGQSVLFQGTGGVSIAGLTLASASGAMTIVTSSSDEKLAIAKKLGAKYTINYKTNPDWEKKVMEITSGKGVDYIFDNVGMAEIAKCLECIAPGGHIESIGVLGGIEISKDVPNIVFQAIMKNATIRGVRCGSRQQLAEVIRFFGARELKPYIDRVFAFGEAKEAFDYLKSQKHIGKIVIKVD